MAPSICSLQCRVAVLLLLSATARPATHGDEGGIFVALSSTLAGGGAPTWTAEDPDRLCAIPAFQPTLALGRLSRPMRRDITTQVEAQAKIDDKFKAECRRIIGDRNTQLGALAQEWRSLDARRAALDQQAAELSRITDSAAAEAEAEGRRSAAAVVARAEAAEHEAVRLKREADELAAAAAARSRRSDAEIERLRLDADAARSEHVKALTAVETDRDAAVQRVAAVESRVAAARSKATELRAEIALLQRQARGVEALTASSRRTPADLVARHDSLVAAHSREMATLVEEAERAEAPVERLRATLARELDVAVARANATRPLEAEIAAAKRSGERAAAELAALEAAVLSARVNLTRTEARRSELAARASAAAADVDAMVRLWDECAGARLW